MKEKLFCFFFNYYSLAKGSAYKGLKVWILCDVPVGSAHRMWTSNALSALRHNEVNFKQMSSA